MSRHPVALLQKDLLAWFRRHHRALPWRQLAGRPDAYRVWLSEIMLQQTTVAAVLPYFHAFVKKWPTLAALAVANRDDVLAAWSGLGYYSRARNLHRCAQDVAAQHDGQFPQDEKTLRRLPGIGPYTAAAVASIAFNREAVAVDGNVERVVSRFFGIETPLPAAKKELARAAARLVRGNPRPAHFTQALMELGSQVCTPKNPDCAACPWRAACRGRKRGIAATLPRKTKKPAKPQRFGKVFWIHDGRGRFVVERRAETGLYAGLHQLPTTEWVADASRMRRMPCPLPGLRVRQTRHILRHSFSHFDLVLEIWEAKTKAAFRPQCGRFIRATDLAGLGLPSLMQKAIRLCLGAGDEVKGKR